jgi:hypothetical protein
MISLPGVTACYIAVHIPVPAAVSNCWLVHVLKLVSGWPASGSLLLLSDWSLSSCVTFESSSVSFELWLEHYTTEYWPIRSDPDAANQQQISRYGPTSNHQLQQEWGNALLSNTQLLQADFYLTAGENTPWWYRAQMAVKCWVEIILTIDYDH